MVILRDFFFSSVATGKVRMLCKQTPTLASRSNSSETQWRSHTHTDIDEEIKLGWKGEEISLSGRSKKGQWGENMTEAPCVHI